MKFFEMHRDCMLAIMIVLNIAVENSYAESLGSHHADADVPCQIAIEKKAKYDYKWTNGFLDSKWTDHLHTGVK